MAVPQAFKITPLASCTGWPTLVTFLVPIRVGDSSALLPVVRAFYLRLQVKQLVPTGPGKFLVTIRVWCGVERNWSNLWCVVVANQSRWWRALSGNYWQFGQPVDQTYTVAPTLLGTVQIDLLKQLGTPTSLNE